MAVPVIESISTYEDASNTTSRTIAKPTGFTTGDWLIFVNGMDGTSAVTMSDFTIIRDVLDSESSSRATLAVRKYTGAEGSTFTIGSASETGKGFLARVSGIDSSATTSNILDFLSICRADCTDTSVFAPRGYTSSDDVLLIAAYVMDGGVANAAATGIPSGYTEQYQDAGISTGVGMSVVSKSAATHGYQAGAVFTASVSTDAYTCFHFGLRSTLTDASLPAQPILKCTEIYQPTSTTADIVIDLPYGTVTNDGLLAHCSTDAGDYLYHSSPSLVDFTEQQAGVVGVSVIRSSIYSFVADASMPSSYTFSATTTASKIGALHRFTNIDTANFIDGSNVNTGTSTSATASTITPTVDNCFIYFGYAADDSNGVTTNANFFASQTGIFTIQSIAGGDTSLSASYQTQTTKTATGSVTATLDVSQEFVAFAVAIRPAAATSRTGTASGTEEDDDGSASGKVYITGTATGTEEEDTGSASGKVYITGTASGTEEEDTGSAAGAPSYVGTASGTEDDDTGTASGNVLIAGAGAATEEDDTGSASGTIPITGTASSTEEDDSGSAAGNIFITGTASGTEDDDVGTASGGSIVSGSASGTEEDDSGSATGVVYIAGSGTATEEDDSGAAAGIVLITGSASGSEEDDTGAASGTVAITGTASGSEDDDSGAATGLVLVAGTSVATEEDDTGTAIGTVNGDSENVTSGGLFQYYDRYVEQERKAKRDALDKINEEIAVIEQEEKPLIKKAKRNTEAEIKLLALREEINALRLEREALVRMIDDEEAIFILLAATPFH